MWFSKDFFILFILSISSKNYFNPGIIVLLKSFILFYFIRISDFLNIALNYEPLKEFFTFLNFFKVSDKKLRLLFLFFSLLFVVEVFSRIFCKG